MMKTPRASTKQPGGQGDLLHKLIRRKGLEQGEYALFFVTGEGEFLPSSPNGDRVEETSGYVLDGRGRVFSFWLGWDATREEPALTAWREVQPEPYWSTNAEYHRARKRVGLLV